MGVAVQREGFDSDGCGTPNWLITLPARAWPLLVPPSQSSASAAGKGCSWAPFRPECHQFIGSWVLDGSMAGAGLACGLLALLVQAPLLAVVDGGQPHQPWNVQPEGTLADQQHRLLPGRALLAEQQAAAQVALEQQQPGAGAGAAATKGAEVGGAVSAAAGAEGGGAGATGAAGGGAAAAVQQAAEGVQQQQPAAAAAKAAEGGGAAAAAGAATDAAGGGGVAAAQAAAGAATAGAAAAEAAAAGGAGQGGSTAGVDQDSVPEPYTVAVPQQGPEAYVAICAAVGPGARQGAIADRARRRFTPLSALRLYHTAGFPRGRCPSPPAFLDCRSRTNILTCGSGSSITAR